MKTKQWSKLAGILFTTGTIGLTVSPVYAYDITGNDNNGLVEINSGRNDNNIYGYKIIDGNATNGKVVISGNTMIRTSSICGGYSEEENSINNEVNISSGDFGVDYISGGGSNSGDSINNEVNIFGGNFVQGFIAGGESNSRDSINNKVNIFNGDFGDGDIYGGRSYSGNSINNKVNIFGGNISNSIYGGYSDSGDSINNEINISGGNISSSIFGGEGRLGDSKNNIVNISGGTVSSSIYGGYSNSKRDVSGNLVILSGNADVSKAQLYGYGGNPSKHTGNTLLIDNWKNNSIGAVRNFDNITFKSIQWENGGVALSITGERIDDQLANTKINVDNFILSSNQKLNINDSMTLIQSSANTGLKKENIINESIPFTQGVVTIGNLEMQLDDATNNLISKISSIERNPQTDIVLDSRVAGTAFVNQGADIATDSLNLLMNDNKYGVHTFGAVYGSQNKYDVNSDLKINGWNTIAGVGNVIRKDNADVAWGIFYENGTGNYRTNNSFNGDFFRSDGSLLYNGGGAAIRYKKDDGMYYEASLRAGTLNSSMSKAVKDGYGNFYGFDSDSNYWGVHLGVGKLLHKDEGEWDLYGKYFHTKLDGDKFDIAGDEFIFDDVTSDRLRLGARYTTDTNNKWDMYYGLAWDYEFNGDSNMKAGQFEAAKESLQGSTGIIELGTILHSNDLPWQADINLKGYVGEKEGLLGMVNLTYLF